MKIKLKNKWKEKIPGGLSVGKVPTDFNAEDIKKGIKVELEHTTDLDIATEIAMDHLSEDPEYYNKLEKIENGANKMKLKIKKKMQETECMDESCGDMADMPQQEPPEDFTGEPDYEGQMAKNQMIKVHDYSGELLDMMSDEMQLPAWVQSKITTIEDYIGAVKHFIEGEMQLDSQEDMMESYVFEASCDDGDLHEMEMFYEECGCGFMESQQLEEAEYQGRKVTLNKPMRGDVKKFKVFVKDPKTGNVKKVNFGDPNMRIKKSNPKRRKSFRARHNCDNPGPKTKARYWSCRKWEE
jgi:hypothetical protein